MIQHLVLLRFDDALPEGQIELIVQALQDYVATVPSVRTYRCGANVGAATNHDFGIAGTFDDVEGWRAYDQGAEHNRIRAELIAPYVAERASAQFTFEG